MNAIKRNVRTTIEMLRRFQKMGLRPTWTPISGTTFSVLLVPDGIETLNKATVPCPCGRCKLMVPVARPQKKFVGRNTATLIDQVTELIEAKMFPVRKVRLMSKRRRRILSYEVTAHA